MLLLPSTAPPNSSLTVLTSPQTINALIIDHLRLCGFDFSLSLFLPESGVTSVDEARQSLKTGLGKRAEDALDERLEDRPEDSLLLKLFQPVTQYGPPQRPVDSKPSVDVDVQTDDVNAPAAGEGSNKNNNGDDDDDGGDARLPFQSRFLQLKKSVEQRKRIEIAEEMERFKGNEIKAVELDYARKLETELEKMRIEFEEKYKQRNAHLDAKERQMEAQVKRKREESERELSNQRNVLIDELQRAKIKVGRNYVDGYSRVIVCGAY